MSLLIKGMDMPERGIHHGAIVISETGNHLVVNSHPYNKCFALSEISTPHGRLIDADAHIQSLKENQCGERCRKNHDCVNCGIGMYIRIVENEPTVMEAEE